MLRKAIVTDVRALKKKYRSAGWTKILAAIHRLIAADAIRGITTSLIAIDDAAQMTGLGGSTVTTIGHEVETKAAIDVIAKTADVILLLGASDVIAHQTLDNPLWTGRAKDDPDKDVPSDLPYACAKPASSRIKDFLRPTRIVSRIPDFVGANEPSHLLTNLATAETWTSTAPSVYKKGLTLSALVWQGASRSCATTLFGAASIVDTSPPGGPGWTATQFSKRMHFINCHGASADPKFYGDDGSTQPVAHTSANLRGKLVAGTVAAVECCYGAELYDPTLDDVSICQTYLAEGAYGYVGSTTISYGPAVAPPLYADIICRSFARAVQRGWTTGEALLIARRDLLSSMATVTPTLQKTLAQFYLLGDGCVRPVHAPAGKKLAAVGAKPLATAAAPVGPVMEPVAAPVSAKVRAAIERIAAEQGLQFSAPQSFAGGAIARGMGAARKKTAGVAIRVHVVFGDPVEPAPLHSTKKMRRRGDGPAVHDGETGPGDLRKILLEIVERGAAIEVHELHRR